MGSSRRKQDTGGRPLWVATSRVSCTLVFLDHGNLICSAPLHLTLMVWNQEPNSVTPPSGYPVDNSVTVTRILTNLAWDQNIRAQTRRCVQCVCNTHHFRTCDQVFSQSPFGPPPSGDTVDGLRAPIILCFLAGCFGRPRHCPHFSCQPCFPVDFWSSVGLQLDVISPFPEYGYLSRQDGVAFTCCPLRPTARPGTCGR